MGISRFIPRGKAPLSICSSLASFTLGMNPNSHTSTGTRQSSTWRADITAGFLVFIIALPLSLGIALASGFPAMAGVWTAIIGGVVTSFLGSAPLTIKGPAAGLAPIAMGAVMALGYEKTLAVGVVAASIQIVFALMRTTVMAEIFSGAVIRGMLAAIGVLLLSKQIYVMLGVTAIAKHPIGLIAELPTRLLDIHPVAGVIGLVCLALLLVWPKIVKRVRVLAPVPVPLLAVGLGVAMASVGLAGSSEGERFMLSVSNNFFDVITFPDFSAVFSGPSIQYIIMFALVGSLESVLSAKAVDTLDPLHRRSDLNKDLLATGVGNLLCGAFGGLPMISEIARSSANAAAGARTAKSNFVHGSLLFAFCLGAPWALRMIPMPALAAILVATGLRLASPSVALAVWREGKVAALVFTTTIAVTIVEDLLMGIIAGVVVDVAARVFRGVGVRQLFSPKMSILETPDEARVELFGHATLFAYPAIARNLKKIRNQSVRLEIYEPAKLDLGLCARLVELQEEWQRSGRALLLGGISPEMLTAAAAAKGGH